MAAARPGLVDLSREFLDAHQLMRRLFARHREGALRFGDLAQLIGDDERSVLFRLKEICHAQFRSGGDDVRLLHREALFDLAVGSLFHEAMKFRENFYQREVYGPRVAALRSQAGAEEAALFDEFARIQEGVSALLEEGLLECEALLARTADQFVALLAAHREDPLVSRFLVEHAREVEDAVGRPVGEVLAAIHGDAAAGYLCAGRSLLLSGYYPEAARALEQAVACHADAREVEPLVAYARGMQAYLARDYGESVARLADWADGTDLEDSSLTRLAHDALSRIGQLVDRADPEHVAQRAAALLGRVSTARSPG